MQKTKLLLMLCVIVLSGCASSSPSAVVIPAAKKIQTEEPGHFQDKWIEYLQNFKKKLAALSFGATSSTSTQSK